MPGVFPSAGLSRYDALSHGGGNEAASIQRVDADIGMNWYLLTRRDIAAILLVIALLRSVFCLCRISKFKLVVKFKSRLWAGLGMHQSGHGRPCLHEEGANKMSRIPLMEDKTDITRASPCPAMPHKRHRNREKAPTLALSV